MTEAPTEPTLNVEYDELMKRADELEVPIPGPSDYSPQPPSQLAQATGAASQLALSADDMRKYMAAGMREWEKLAESLRNAAKAYEETDAAAADSITNETSVSAVSVAPSPYTDEELDALLYTAGGANPAIDPLPYYPVEEAAYDIAELDQGTGFYSFADEWEAYQVAMRQAFDRFRPFEYWEGDAAGAVESSMQQQRDWLAQMADRCGEMATQAREVVAAQRTALPVHPTVEQIAAIQDGWVQYQTDPALQPYWPEAKAEFEFKLQSYQQQSEEVLADYVEQASLPLTPAQPDLPPTAYAIAAPSDGGTGPGAGARIAKYLVTGGMPSGDAASTLQGAMAASDTTPTDDTLPTDMPTAMPVVPPPGSSTGSGVKPASLGAGGIGAGMPAMPLEAPIEAGSATRPSAAGLVGLPGAAAGGRGATGGAGMPGGGAPGGKNQNDKKGKRIDQGDEAIYKEMRPWTAAVIGNRRRNELPGVNAGEAVA